MHVYNRLEVQIIQSIAKNTAISVLCRQNSPGTRSSHLQRRRNGSGQDLRGRPAPKGSQGPPRCWAQIMFRSSNDQEQGLVNVPIEQASVSASALNIEVFHKQSPCVISPHMGMSENGVYPQL